MVITICRSKVWSGRYKCLYILWFCFGVDSFPLCLEPHFAICILLFQMVHCKRRKLLWFNAYLIVYKMHCSKVTWRLTHMVLWPLDQIWTSASLMVDSDSQTIVLIWKLRRRTCFQNYVANVVIFSLLTYFRNLYFKTVYLLFIFFKFLVIQGSTGCLSVRF